ncbi:hypothetical protein TWF696_008090 [Orbilia brochopaga]|uniref:Uncharacterized protein n=1 Tax=Orbilia brochopaga TaxID=3140254 RepID=A0AAV9UM22_9PEZI
MYDTNTATNRILAYLKRMNNVFQKGILQTPAGKPTIYCNGDWAERQDPETDFLRDIHGNIDPRNILLKDFEPYRELLYNSDGTRNKPVTLHWIPDENKYMFIKLPRGNARICSRSTEALTIYNRGKLTVCPTTFDLDNPKKVRWRNIPPADAVDPLAYLGSFMTYSDVIFHETGHMVLGKFVTPEVYTIPECLEAAASTPKIVIGSPQCLYFFGLGATLSRLARTRQNPPPVYLDFSDSMAAQS